MASGNVVVKYPDLMKRPQHPLTGEEIANADEAIERVRALVALVKYHEQAHRHLELLAHQVHKGALEEFDVSTEPDEVHETAIADALAVIEQDLAVIRGVVDQAAGRELA